MIARDAEGVAGRDHAHDEAQHARCVRPAVDEVADEDRPPIRVMGAGGPAPVVAGDRVAELAEQRLQLDAAAVDVADDIERAVLVAQVVVQRRPGDPDAGDLVDPAQRVHGAEALTLQPLEPTAQLVALSAHDRRTEVALGAGGVALQADVLRDVQDDRHRQHVVRPGHGDELLAGLGLDVRRVDDGEAAPGQPDADDVVQQVERGRCRGLVVLVVGHEAAAEVRGDDLGRPEVGAAERRLARSAHPDEDDEAELRDGEFPRHARAPIRSKTAIWVGGPTSGSSVPIGMYRTE